jgi:phospholipid-binding lipoprotein MlaA
LSLARLTLRGCIAFAMLVLASGCATLPPNAGQDPRDPWEKYNRNMFAFNDGFDEAITKPLAELYVKLPQGMRTCLSNAFSNLRGPSTAINNFFQSKPVEALSDVGRFAVNTTVGIVGCFDVATGWGMEAHREDFGQTLGVWGFEPGPYLVMPIFGPSSVRDAIGIYGVEPFLDLNFYIDYPGIEYTVLGLRVVNERAELLPADRLVREAALDRYTFIRDGYLQRRRSLVYDGNPPRVIDPDDEDDGDDAKAPVPGRGASSGPTQTQPPAPPGDGAVRPADAKPGETAK